VVIDILFTESNQYKNCRVYKNSMFEFVVWSAADGVLPGLMCYGNKQQGGLFNVTHFIVIHYT